MDMLLGKPAGKCCNNPFFFWNLLEKYPFIENVHPTETQSISIAFTFYIFPLGFNSNAKLFQDVPLKKYFVDL